MITKVPDTVVRHLAGSPDCSGLANGESVLEAGHCHASPALPPSKMKAWGHSKRCWTRHPIGNASKSIRCRLGSMPRWRDGVGLFRVAMHTSAAGILIAFACVGVNDAQAQQKVTTPITLASDTDQSGASSSTFANAVALHNAGRAGDARAVTQAVEAFGDLVKADGSDPIANAYLGSSYTLMGREAKSGPDKLR